MDALGRLVQSMTNGPKSKVTFDRCPNVAMRRTMGMDSSTYGSGVADGLDSDRQHYRFGRTHPDGARRDGDAEPPAKDGTRGESRRSTISAVGALQRAFNRFDA